MGGAASGVGFARVVAGALIDELNSRVGSGGGLTRQGALDSIALMSRKREVLRKVELLMETGEAGLVEGIVEILCRKAAAGDGGRTLGIADARPSQRP